ncbi:MAG: OB-fold nucleic acid binding domain-containing protein [Pseudomonadota bacterium]
MIGTALLPSVSEPRPWPRPPACIPNARLGEPAAGARITVAGLVLVRQRPGTAKGVIFITLEDETGTCNVVVWAKTYERFRRAVIAGRLLRVTGRIQREAGVVHIVAETIEDISAMLDDLISYHELCRAGDQPETTRPAYLGR